MKNYGTVGIVINDAEEVHVTTTDPPDKHFYVGFHDAVSAYLLIEPSELAPFIEKLNTALMSYQSSQAENTPNE